MSASVDRGPTPVDGTTRSAFRALAGLRRARAFHPVGVALRGIATVDGAAPRGIPPGRWPAVVRFSRGVGLPEPLPDLLGIAARLDDAAGHGDPFDLLMTTTWSGAVGRHVLRPTRSFSSGWATTLLPYAGRDGTVHFATRVLTTGIDGLADVANRAGPAGSGEPVDVELAWAAGAGPWQRFAAIELTGRLDPDEERDLDLDPFHTSPDLVPAGLVNRLRRPAYVGSREGRPGGSAP